MAAPKLDPGAALMNAAQAYSKGDATAAERGCRALLQHWPDFPDAMHMLGLILHQRGDHRNAENWLVRTLKKQPDNPQASNTLGSIYKALGDLTRAATLFSKAKQLAPDYLDPYLNLALVRIEQAQPLEAIPLLDFVVAKNPMHARAHSVLGDTFAQLNDIARANASYQIAARLAPEQMVIRYALAVTHRKLGDFAQAELLLKQVVAHDPTNLDALIELGNTLLAQKKHDEAIACYQSLLSLKHNHAGALNNLAALYEDTDQSELAEEHYRKALAHDPNDRDANANLGRLLCNQGRPDEAETFCQRGVALTPNSASAQLSLAFCYYLKHDYTGSEMCYRRALALDPNNSRALYSLGNIGVKRGKFLDSVAYFERAMEADPTHLDAAFNLGISHLTLGNYANGWHYYFQRPRIVVERDTLSPFSPDMPLVGKKILLTKAQGIGDELFYLRFAPLLAARGAEISYRPDPKIVSLLQDQSCIHQLLSLEEPYSGDYTFAVDDLPLLLQMGDHSPIPEPLALAPQTSRIEHWRDALKALGPPPYIAVTWRAGTAGKAPKKGFNQLYKAIELPLLADLLRNTNATLLVLQRHPESDEISTFSRAAGRAAHDLSYVNDSLDDMLALLDVIDDYVGVSNTNMHLRAGLNKPAQILVPHPTDWRWQLVGEKSPWFPQFNVYREIYGAGWNTALQCLQYYLRRYA